MKTNISARRTMTTLAALGAAAIVAAGCGSDSKSSSSPTDSKKSDSAMKDGGTKDPADAAMKDDPASDPAMEGDHPAMADGGAAGAALTSTIAFDAEKGSATLPLFTGTGPKGDQVSYIVTESSDEADAKRRGVNFAPKLKNALGTKAIQQVTGSDGALSFPATVDFRPTRVVKPGKQGFPPLKVKAGASAGPAYSPLVTTGDGIVLNAPQVANSTGKNDSVLSVDAAKDSVTLAAFTGFGDGQKILYIRTEGSVELLAAVEGTTLAPSLNSLPGLASSSDSSPREAIVPIINGERTGPNRQGLESALLGGGSPLNVVESLPGNPSYSPIWDVAPAAWTPAAISAGKRKLLTSTPDVAAAFARGELTSAIADGTPNAGLKGLRAAGFISNCSVIALIKA